MRSLAFAVALTSVAVLPVRVDSHGAMVTPPSRNAVDRHLPFENTQDYSCNCGCCREGCGAVKTCNVTGQGGCEAPGARAHMSGQPCLWFSQGCGIGCDSCNNHTQHSMGKPLCAKEMEPTLPKAMWTMNRHANVDPERDVFKYHPWRAPGFAPVVDVCGMAGGGPHPGGGAGVFTKTQWAQQGDLGSHVLKPQPSGTVWAAGSSVEVGWALRANHGGGYQYRLCKASETLTEECMQRTPLAFAGKSYLRYNDGSTGPLFEGVDVSTGTRPTGSTWRMNPVPPIVDPAWTDTPKELCNTTATGFPLSLGCRQFVSPACEEGQGSHGTVPWKPIPGYGRAGPEVMGPCSGNLINAVIVDHVLIPHDLPPGDYVVGFRWDCEETAQVWSSCADVSIRL